jgi:hypothetical protein
MSLRLATMNENARSALECGREAAAFGSFPSAHAPTACMTKAVAAATAVHQRLRHSHFHSRAQRDTQKKAVETLYSEDVPGIHAPGVLQVVNPFK